MSGLPSSLGLSVFRRMADMSHEAFYVTDYEGRFRYVNQRALDLSGYTREELSHMRTFDLNPDYSLEAYRLSVDTFMPGMPLIETRSRRKDGTFFPVEVSVAIFEAGGEKYVFGVVRDITARKQAENAQRTFAQRMLQTLEAERQRVAVELHDEVGQGLATVGALLRSLECAPGATPAPTRTALTATIATIREITESVARIVTDYHPADLLELGLEDTLRAHARQFAEHHALTIRLVTTPVTGALDRDRELHLYRIAQEALANVARHARASRVVVRLQRHRSHVVLTVRDDGVGIAAGRMSAPGLGLVTMRERAELMHADLRIRTPHRGGTEVRIAVPIADDRLMVPAAESAGRRPAASRPLPARRRRRVSARARQR
jgi:two-component system sensor histidine kinase UhpB